MLNYQIDEKIYRDKYCVIPRYKDMGNFADQELLFCDEKLNVFNDDCDMKEIIKHLNNMSIENTTLKPQHLMFDGLDQEYEFSHNMNWNTDECMTDLWKVPEQWKEKPYDSDEGSDSWCMNDFIGIRNFQVHNNLEPLNLDCVGGDNLNFDYNESGIKSYEPIKFSSDEEINEYCINYNIPTVEDVYDGMYYELQEHNWSLPERDEMSDLQDKVDYMYIDDHYMDHLN